MAHSVGLWYEDAKTDEELLKEQIAEKDKQIADMQRQLEECQAGQGGGA